MKCYARSGVALAPENLYFAPLSLVTAVPEEWVSALRWEGTEVPPKATPAAAALAEGHNSADMHIDRFAMAGHSRTAYRTTANHCSS